MAGYLYSLSPIKTDTQGAQRDLLKIRIEKRILFDRTKTKINFSFPKHPVGLLRGHLKKEKLIQNRTWKNKI
jgi:hypothetical protein